MYKVLWEPRVGETFIVVYKTGNEHGRYAMAVYRDEEPGGAIVGNLPWETVDELYDEVGLAVGSALENMGTPVVESLTETFRRYQLTSDT